MTSFRHSLGPPVRYFSCLNFNLSGDATLGGLIRISAIFINSLAITYGAKILKDPQ